MKYLSLLPIFLLFLAEISVAQEGGLKRPPMQFQHLTEGLNNERITTIFQDSLGFIWIGSYNGLHRFDGIKYKVYLSTADETSLSHSRIEKIYSDRKGHLWIGTANSISRYKRETDSFERFSVSSGLVDASDPAPNRISAITEDENGKLWVGSEKEGLFYFDQNKQAFIPYFSKKTGLSLSSIKISDLEFGKPGELWIGLTTGLNKLNIKSGKVTHFSARPENPYNIEGKNIRGMETDANGDLWIGTRSNGLFLLKEKNQNRNLFDHYGHHPDDPESLGNNSVYSLLIDSQNQVWVGNENGGLHLYDRTNDSFYRYMPDPLDPFSISNNSIWSIFEDKQGRLWIGTGLKGVNVADRYYAKFTHYYNSPLNPEGLSNNVIRSFSEDKEGNVWIATDGGGLNYWNRQTDKISHYTSDPNNPKSIKSNALLDFTKDAAGRLWIATWAGGINVLTDSRKMEFSSLEEIYPADSLAASIVNSFALHTRQNGDIISGNYGVGMGIHSQESQRTQLFQNDPKDKNSLSSVTLYSIFEDSEGNVWGGGETNGLSRLTENGKGKVSFKRYNHIPEDSTSLAGEIVNQIYEDAGKNIWLATSGGLSMYVKESDNFISYSSKHGLPTDFIVSVVEDEDGFLWVGSEKGLTKFDPENKTFRNYSKSDGLQGDKFSRHSVAALSGGELVFGGTNGFNIFYPGEVKDNPHKPEVYLTDLKLFNNSVVVGENDSLLKRDISLTREIRLQYHQNVIGLEFVALNYTHPTRNQYAYMLEGLETDWNYVGNIQNATYTNLDPGDYTFRVKASNNDGVWNEEGAQVKIIVLPPWYRTWWFYTMAVVFTGFVFFVFIRWREKRLKEDKEILNNAIETKTAELEKKQAEIMARDEADKIRNWTAQGLNEFSQIVNKNKDDIGVLAQSILSRLVKFMHAGQGTVSLLNDDNEEDKFLELIATYAHEKGRNASLRTELTQGLTGACYSSGEVKYIDNLPADYSKLTSGLGEARMNYLVLVPLKLEEYIVGVVELCSFEAFEEHEIEFLRKMGEIVTASLYTLKVSHRTSLLLEQARAQSEELQAQEEEIRQNMEELEATQEDFFRKEQELQEKLRAAEEEIEKLRKSRNKKKPQE